MDDKLVTPRTGSPFCMNNVNLTEFHRSDHVALMTGSGSSGVASLEAIPTLDDLLRTEDIVSVYAVEREMWLSLRLWYYRDGSHRCLYQSELFKQTVLWPEKRA